MTGERPLDRIVIVLWETQDLVNIAGTIRAMKNFGLSRLRLVSPSEWDPWRIEGIAHDTTDLVARTELFDSLQEAIADCSFTVAMTARERRAKRDVARPRETAVDLLERASDEAAGPVGIVFGREDQGLPNWALDLCHRTVTIPTNPEHSSLNLAQAVLVVGYEWFTARAAPPAEHLHTGHSRPANKEELIRFFEHFEEALVLSGFLRHPDKRPSMTRNLRNLFQRAGCTEQELRTLHGVVTAFLGPRKRGGAAEQ